MENIYLKSSSCNMKDKYERTTITKVSGVSVGDTYNNSVIKRFLLSCEGIVKFLVVELEDGSIIPSSEL